MKTLFVCKASVSIGVGHVMRCLSVANMLRGKGWECDFFCTKETPEVAISLKNSSYKLLYSEDNVPQNYDVIIIDDYEIDKSKEQSFRSLGKNIVVIDDLANRNHDCDVLIDQTFGRKKNDYKDIVPHHCKILTGACYALIQPEFSKLRSESLNRRENMHGLVKNILISLGGTDSQNITSYILKELQFLKEKISINVILNSKSSFKKEVEKECLKLRNIGLDVHLRFDITDMAEVMSQADLAIGAAGTTSWERCCLGLPTIMIETADNQKYVGEALHKSFAADNLGVFSSIKTGDILSKLKFYIETPEKLEQMTQNAAEIVDGKGISRVVPYIVGAEENGVILRPMDQEDMEILFDWQSNEETRKYSRNRSAPSWGGHEKWFSQAISDPLRHLYMVMCGDDNVGMLRLDYRDNADNNASSYEISILISPESYGKGFAKSALRLIRKIEPKVEIWAEIFMENKASINLFKSAGYQKVNKTWYRERGHENI